VLAELIEKVMWINLKV